MPSVAIPTRERGADASTKLDLLTDLERDYSRFASAVASIREREFRERWLDARWGVAEVVAVHVGWLEKLNEALTLALQGVPLEQIEWLDVERWEEAFYGLPAGGHRTALLKQLKRAFDRFIATATELPEQQYSEDGVVTKMFNYVGVCKFKLHASLIEAWRDGRLSNLPRPPVTTPGSFAA